MSSEERNENRNADDFGMEIFIPSERRHNKRVNTFYYTRHEPSLQSSKSSVLYLQTELSKEVHMFRATRSFLAWLSLSEVRRYGAVVASNLITMLVQVILVLASGSLALLSDTVHLGSDSVVTIGSLVVALVSIRATKATDRMIRKWFAFAGILLLWIGAYHILGEAEDRMTNPVDIKNWWVLIGGVLGGTGNLISLFILRTAPHGDHNHTHSILNWHVFFDFLFSVVVVISALLAITYNIMGIDAWVSYRMALFMIGLGGFLFARVAGGHEHHH